MDSGDPLDPTEGTRVDLGDDLLEKTAVARPGAPAGSDARTQPPQLVLHDLSDAFESARILQNEGFLDEAKKLLRKILISDSRHWEAKEKLAEIHELELKQILEGREPVRPRLRGMDPSPAPEHPSDFDADAIRSRLVRDLNLEPRDEDGPLELVRDAGTSANYVQFLVRKLGALDARASLDLGIAYFEMGLYSVAERLFELSGQLDTSGMAESAVLRVEALVQLERWADAEMVLDEVLARGMADLEAYTRLECAYWKARILSARGRGGEAEAWFLEVIQADPTYRDALDRYHRGKRR
jgi:tetratricopeptide (TPR) repeat protein